MSNKHEKNEGTKGTRVKGLKFLSSESQKGSKKMCDKKKTFEKILAENLLNLAKDINLHIQEAR